MPTIATWNVNSLRVRLPHVLDWCKSASPDVLALQETKSQDPDFPQQAIEDAGYHVVFAGQKTYNGVAILSREQPTDIVTDLPGLDDPQRRLLAATCGDIRVINVYIPNGQSLESEKFEYKLNWLEHLDQFIRSEHEKHKNLVLLGDFNIAPDDRDVYDPEVWHDKILCSTPERDALQSLLDAGLTDVFRLQEQEEEQFSWWDYRMNGFRRNRGLRIDLILASQALCKNSPRSWIDKTPRSWERPSDHCPVIADFA